MDRDVDFPMSISTEPIALQSEPDPLESVDVIIPTTAETIQVTAITDVEMLTPWYLKLTWFQYETSLTMLSLSAIFYWLGQFQDSSRTRTLFETNNNLILPLIMLVDLLISKTPIRLLHCCYVYITCILYACVSILYSRSGTHDIAVEKIYRYSDKIVTDIRWLNHCDAVLPFGPWSSHIQEAVVSIAVCVVMVPLIHFIWFLIYEGRLYAWRRYGYCIT